MGIRTFIVIGAAGAALAAAQNRAIAEDDFKRAGSMRSLNGAELEIAKLVFKNTVPYDRVIVTDGIGASGRPYVIPLPSSGYFLMNVGHNGFAGMERTQKLKELLVHEMTHVWQGAQATITWGPQGSSVVHQVVRGDGAYSYDPATLGQVDWDDYNPEQQAQIVEDWFENATAKAGVLDEDTADDRYVFIVTKIRGEGAMPFTAKVSPDYGVTRITQTARNPASPTVSDHRLITLLEQQFRPGDAAGIKARFDEIAGEFERLTGLQASPLYARLVNKPPGDKVAALFYSRLSQAGRDTLLAILRGRLTVT